MIKDISLPGPDGKLPSYMLKILSRGCFFNYVHLLHITFVRLDDDCQYSTVNIINELKRNEKMIQVNIVLIMRDVGLFVTYRIGLNHSSRQSDAVDYWVGC